MLYVINRHDIRPRKEYRGPYLSPKNHIFCLFVRENHAFSASSGTGTSGYNVSDPHSFHVDPDPAQNLNADPDSSVLGC